ncbi:MAG: hypothetical protein ABIN41_00055 [Devosia sp.]
MHLHARHIVVAALLLLPLDLPAAAQGLNLNLGGINVGVDVGGSGGTGVSVGVGSNNVEVGLGDGGGGLLGTDVGVTADLFGPADNQSNQPIVLSQADALAAVNSRRALPLDRVMVAAQLSTTGQIIDANLVSLNNFLLYVFKVLETDGDVSELYFYARSGQMVQSR